MGFIVRVLQGTVAEIGFPAFRTERVWIEVLAAEQNASTTCSHVPIDEFLRRPILVLAITELDSFYQSLLYDRIASSVELWPITDYELKLAAPLSSRVSPRENRH